jgi:hypothetical protein
MDFNATDKQIRDIIVYLVENYIAMDQNFPNARGGVIGLKSRDLSYMLKDRPYFEVYKICAQNHDYHIQLLDGALIQFHYVFDGDKGEILKHRLNYLPHPDLESYCENPDFEKEHHGDLLFADIKTQSSIQFPIRFDFDASDTVFREKWHSRSHLTLGNVANCRIPVLSAISPNRFMDFILRCFYSKKYEADLKEFDCGLSFAASLNNSEKSLLHLGFE